MFSPEEIEDLSLDFSMANEDALDDFEDRLVEATRRSDYDVFMAVHNEFKDFCYKAGPGGRFYFDDMWKDDPRIKSLKQIKDGPKYSDVVSMLSECGPSESKDIYLLVEGANYKVLQALIRKMAILRLPDSHVYYLPGQDVSQIAEAKEEARRPAKECQGDPVELTVPSPDEVLGKMCSILEDGLRERGATEEQIDQAFGRKKRRGFFSFFRKKK